MFLRFGARKTVKNQSKTPGLQIRVQEFDSPTRLHYISLSKLRFSQADRARHASWLWHPLCFNRIIRQTRKIAPIDPTGRCPAGGDVASHETNN